MANLTIVECPSASTAAKWFALQSCSVDSKSRGGAARPHYANLTRRLQFATGRCRKRRFRLGSGNIVRAITLMAWLTSVVTSLAAQISQDEKSQAPTVTSAKDGIFAAFQTHPLVGIGDHH